MPQSVVPPFSGNRHTTRQWSRSPAVFHTALFPDLRQPPELRRVSHSRVPREVAPHINSKECHYASKRLCGWTGSFKRNCSHSRPYHHPVQGSTKVCKGLDGSFGRNSLGAQSGPPFLDHVGREQEERGTEWGIQIQSSTYWVSWKW